MIPDKLDHRSLGTSRVATQFSASTKFLLVVYVLTTLANEIEDLLLSLGNLADVDQMRGVNLDTIGEIVGVSRFISGVVTLSFFGFSEEADGTHLYYVTVFGEASDLSIGSRFYEEGEPYTATSILSDPEYRMLIRAKIVRNSSRGTVEDMLAGLRYIFAINDVGVVDSGNMQCRLYVGRKLTATEQALIYQIDILPRPMGVTIAAIDTH
jgi:hypothetical protein